MSSPTPASSNTSSSSFQPFPLRFYQVINEVAVEQEKPVVQWSSDGRSFAIHDLKAFCDTVLQPYFSCHKYPSFKRKLNRWGFRRRPIMDYENEFTTASIVFWADQFRRDEPELLTQMRMQRSAGDKRLSPSPNQDYKSKESNKKQKTTRFLSPNEEADEDEEGDSIPLDAYQEKASSKGTKSKYGCITTTDEDDDDTSAHVCADALAAAAASDSATVTQRQQSQVLPAVSQHESTAFSLASTAGASLDWCTHPCQASVAAPLAASAPPSMATTNPSPAELFASAYSSSLPLSSLLTTAAPPTFGQQQQLAPWTIPQAASLSSLLQHGHSTAEQQASATSDRNNSSNLLLKGILNGNNRHATLQTQLQLQQQQDQLQQQQQQQDEQQQHNVLLLRRLIQARKLELLKRIKQHASTDKDNLPPGNF